MTIVCYSKGILASDTRATTGEGMAIRSKKIEELKNGTIVGTAGDSDCREVLDLLSKATIAKMPSKAVLCKTQTTFEGIWIFPSENKVFIIAIESVEDKWYAEIRPMLDDWAAIGSGGKYAAAAIMAGKSAVEAVRITCKLDTNCGLPIESIKIKT